MRLTNACVGNWLALFSEYSELPAQQHTQTTDKRSKYFHGIKEETSERRFLFLQQ
jgi:hypothetical protein